MQRQDGPVEKFRPDDTVWFPPGEKHWHGATPDTGMQHIAAAKAHNGKVVDGWRKVPTTITAGDGVPTRRG